MGGFAGKKWGLGGRVVIVLTTLRTAGCFAAFDIGVKVELEIVVVVIFCPAVVERGTGDGAVSCELSCVADLAEPPVKTPVVLLFS